MMARRRRHFFKALLAFAGLVGIALLVQLGAEQNIVPSWEVLITRPISTWTSKPDEEIVKNDAKVRSIIPAPALSEPIPPVRVANNPGPKSSHVSPDQERRTDSGEKPSSESNRMVHEGSETLPVAMERQPPKSPDSSDEAAPGEGQAKIPDQAESDGDQSMVEGKSANLMATGGELQAQGVSLPCLIAVWELDDLEKLVTESFGFIVVKWREQSFHVIPKDGSFLSSNEFLPLIKETKDKMSNRGIDLNRRSQGRSYKDTSLRPALKALEERFIARMGGGAKGEVPVFTFFPSNVFEAYLSRKQLGALASMGFDVQDPKWAKKTVTTIGTIVLTARRPIYVIDSVQVGPVTHPWKDPERSLVSRKG